MSNEPAFPNDFTFPENRGLTKREHIAAEIAAGMCSSESEADGYWDDEKLAARAVKRADALLAELAKARS